MLLKRKASAQSSDNRSSTAKCLPIKSSSKLFQPGQRIIVQRAPILSGLSIPAGLQKKFQRPMLKRRAYGKSADAALQQSSLGQRRRMDGMAKLLARAGRGLSYKLPQTKKADGDTDESSDSEDDEEEREPDRPFEPLQVWTSPHQGGEAKGLPATLVNELRPDEYGIEESVTVLKPAPAQAYSKENVLVSPVLAKWLRPHQREGVQFMYECVMGLKDFRGNGCILADDMGLGKTLQSVTLIYTLLKTGITANGQPTAKRVIVVCPCSLVKNWENEFVKWLGAGAVKTLALAEADRKTVEKNIDIFVRTKMFNVLIASYECIRTHVKRLTKYADCCDLLVCDEAHRLKNSENQTSRALNSLPVKRRVLLTGTPMQNDLQEFYAMVDFTNPDILGTQEEFRRKMLFPILRGREPDATEAQKQKMMQIQQDMSATVNDFILRRINTLNAQHLPPKLVQVVCCNLTEIQQNMYQHLVTSKDIQHVLDGKQVNCLSSIQMLMKLCNHPSLVAEEDKAFGGGNKRAAARKTIKYSDEDKESAAAPGADGISKFLPYVPGEGGRKDFAPVHPDWSGKMFVLYRLMKEMRKPGNGNDKIVIVSNYTQTLDLIGRMCRENSWGFCRLDGSITMKKRQKMVDEFNDPSSSLVAFLLSSKAGGCGLNLIGANRLVLFDPDWNPAVDKQAAARCWRDGQKKRCFTYRFMATGTVEEKIFQRQLSKEGLQSVVDDKEQVNALSTKDLRNLFKLRTGTPSDTHDKLRCERCEIIHDNAEMEAMKVLPKKLAACRELLEVMKREEDAKFFLKPLEASEHGRTKEEYEKLVKQPMDFGTISSKFELSPEHASSYKSVSGFSKDVNRIFSNVLKVWSPGEDIADASRRLQSWWVDQWHGLVPRLMAMKADDVEKKDEVEDSVGDILESCANVHNERGEDYQEQIGMPDEENMRHWSHHYSADTVDDPVFRAAVRGCDAVSFVFGLEVTWSLIQQRQQEEEERLAMEELEKMQESEDDDDDSAPHDRKLPAVASNDSTSKQDSESDSEEDAVKNAAISAPKDGSDSDEDSVAADMPVEVARRRASDAGSEATYEKSTKLCVQSKGDECTAFTAENSTPCAEAEIVETSPEGSAMEAEIYAGSSQETSASSHYEKENSENAAGPSSKWACPTCTLHNKKAARKCEACGAKKPRASKKRSIDELSL